MYHFRGLAAGLGRHLLQSAKASDSAGAVRCKQTTGIVGLEVVAEARAVLRDRCNDVLKAVQVIPDHAEYRRVVEATMNHRLA